MRRRPLPLDGRLEADRPITAELLAVTAEQPLELAGRYLDLWFRTARAAVRCGLVLVFDDLVVGPPCPLLLEAAHLVRETRRAERRGDFDDEEDRWYELHDDDDDAVWEPPTITDRVLDDLAAGQEADRLVDGAVVSSVVVRALDLPIEQLLPAIGLGSAVRRLLVELADGIRIADAVAVDARLPGEIFESRWWAA